MYEQLISLVFILMAALVAPAKLTKELSKTTLAQLL